MIKSLITKKYKGNIISKNMIVVDKNEEMAIFTFNLYMLQASTALIAVGAEKAIIILPIKIGSLKDKLQQNRRLKEVQ